MPMHAITNINAIHSCIKALVRHFFLYLFLSSKL